MKDPYQRPDRVNSCYHSQAVTLRRNSRTVSRLGGSLDREIVTSTSAAVVTSGQDDTSDHTQFLDLIWWYRKDQRGLAP
jgi:hypothetical protein